MLTDATGAIDAAARFFAAQTLKHKLVADYVQLDEGMRHFLRETLLGVVLGTASGTTWASMGRPVMQQLVLALAALIVQSDPDLWPTPISDLLGQLQTIRERANTSPSLAGVHATGATGRILQVLACIPEQMENPLICTSMSGPVREQQRRRLIDDNVDRMITLIGHELTNEGGADRGTRHERVPLGEREQLLGCLLSWIKYGSSANPQLVGSPQLLQSMLSVLKGDVSGDPALLSSGTLEVSSEITCELFYRLFQSDQVASAEYLSVLFGGLLYMLPSLKRLLHPGAGEGREEEEEEVSVESVLAIGRVYLEAGEAFLPLILENGPAMQVIIEAALALAHYRPTLGADWRVVEATFGWWSSLEARLSEASEGVREPFWLVFAELFRTLVTRHLAFPPEDQGAILTAEERDAFRDFRHVIGDCLKDCTRVMGSTAALLLVRDLFLQASASTSAAAASATLSSSWQPVEAALFALRTISSSVDRRETEALPGIFRSLLALDTNSCHAKVVYGIILNIGCYAEWARYHEEFIGPFLNYLLAGLREHGPAASLALKYLAQSCDTQLRVHEPSLRSAYGQCHAALAVVGGPGWIAARDMQEISEAVACVLSTLPEEQLAPLLSIYLGPWLALLPRPVALDNLAVFIELLGGGDNDNNDGDGDGDDRNGRSHGTGDSRPRPTPIMEGFIQQLLHVLASLPRSTLVADEATAESLTMLLKTIIVHHRMGGDLVDLLVSLYVEGGVSGSLYALRYIVMAQPRVLSWAQLQGILATIIGETVPSSGTRGGAPVTADFYHLLTAVVDYWYEPGEVLSLEGTHWRRILELAQGTLAASPCNPHDVLGVLLLLLHLFPRLGQVASGSSSSGAGNESGTGTGAGVGAERRAPPIDIILSGLLTAVQAALQGAITEYPPTLQSDVSALLRRLHDYSASSWRELMRALLAALPVTAFVEREREAWMGRFEAAATSQRPREMKEALGSFIGACRRRL